MPSSEAARPLVSVIMIYRDAARFIDEAIASVQAQSLPDWELLLVDDGSSDRGPEIASAWHAREGGRIRLLQHPGGAWRGTAASRNLGLRSARGSYLAFLDADDVYEPERLARHVACLEADPALGVVLGRELYWHSWHAGSPPDWISGPALQPGRRYTPPDALLATLLTRGAAIPAPCSITFRREEWLAQDPIPERFHGHYEDQVLICRLLLRYPALVIEDCLARYRQHPASLTEGNAPLERVAGSAANRARAEFLDWLRGELAGVGCLSPELVTWLDAEAAAVAGAGERSGRSWRRLARHSLPQAARVPVGRALNRWRGRGARRRAMQQVAQFERGRAGRSSLAAARDYWNERIDDTRLSDHPRGSAGFYAALDAHRLRKSDYLLDYVDFAAWAGHDVLEIGCGAGLDLVRFARAGARVTGVDLASRALELARGCCAVAGAQAELVEADGAHLPWPDASFDLVYCLGVLPFAPDPAGVVAEAHRLLRPGGTAIFMVYNRHSWMQLAARLGFLRLGHADAPGFRVYSRTEFARLLQPFVNCRMSSARLPLGQAGRRGAAARILASGMRPVLGPFGWHLLARCRKAL
ncbi:MAG: glycosyltransferase [Gammaproteobacteria bacterium]|nr:MAG: glycosyltransferase [Gammaproteobacteria bacterium]